MARGDVAYLMSKHASQLSLVIHQTDELSCRVNVATWDREGVIHRAVKQGDAKRIASVAQSRLDRDRLADGFHIGSLGPCHGPAEFLEDLDVGLCALLRLGLADLLCRSGPCLRIGASGHRKRGNRRQQGGTRRA